MNFDIIPADWKDAVAGLCKDHGCESVDLFNEAPVQTPAECMVWIADYADDIADKLKWFAARASKIGFLVLPYKDDAEAQRYQKALDGLISVHEWLVFPGNPHGRIIATVQRWNRVGMGEIIGATDPEVRWQQIVANSAKVKARVPFVAEAHKKPCIIVCYGPSIHETWQHAVSEAKFLGGTLATNSGAHDFLISKGVVPHYHVEMDPREVRCGFTDTPHKDVKYLLASTVHPKLVEKLDGFDMSLWHSMNGAESQRIFDLEPDATGISGGSCVGLRSITLFHSLGYRYFSIYGFDCSFRDETKKWAGKHPGGTKHKTIEVKCGDRVFKSAPLLAAYATQFFDTMKRLPDSEFYLHGDGLLQHMARVSVQSFKDRTAKEKVA